MSFLDRMHLIYKMESYTSVKSNDIMKFGGEWVELEKKSWGNLDPERQA